MQSILVKFNNYGTNYEYLLCPGQNPSVGGKAVVDVSGVLKIVNIVEVKRLASDKAEKYVVSLVDTTAYDEHNASMRRAANLKKELDKRLKEFEKANELEKYSRLVESDSQALAILNELRALKGK